MQPDDQMSLGATIRAALRRYLLIVLIAALAGAALGYAASRALGSTYSATSAIILRPAIGNALSPSVAGGSTNQVTVAMATEVSLVTTPTVAQAASETARTEIPGPGDKVKATVPPSTQIVEITFSAKTPDRAQLGAQAYADAFLAARAENATKATEAQVASLKKQLSTAETNLKTASAQAASQTDPRSYAAQQLQLYAERVANLRNQIGDAESASTDPGLVIRRSQLPTSADGIPVWLLVFVGTLLGLGAGAVFAVARHARDRRITTKDAAAVEGLPVLASVRSTVSEPAAADPVIREAFRQTRTAITSGLDGGSVVAITSTAPAQPTAAVASGVADSLAKAGYRSALIDLAGPLEGPGIGAALPPATQQGEVRAFGLRALATVDELAGPAFREHLSGLRADFDYVILAAAPIGSSAGDAAAAVSDATVVVATERRSTTDDLRTARQRLLRLGSPALGIFGVTSVRDHEIPQAAESASLPPSA